RVRPLRAAELFLTAPSHPPDENQPPRSGKRSSPISPAPATTPRYEEVRPTVLSVRHKHADCAERARPAARRKRPRERPAADKPDGFESFHRITARQVREVLNRGGRGRLPDRKD